MQQQQQGGKPAAGKQQPEDKVYLAINRRENSIMAVATPDKLAVIDQAVTFLDVPSAARSPLAGLSGVQMYRLVAADPAPIVAVLKDMGNLDPATRIEVDNVNKAIIVSGPLVDHVTVKSLIDKLDGSARQFEVLQLRKLDADYVAGSIEFLMRGPKEQNSRPRYFWFDGGNRQQNSDKEGGFQVEADTKNNRLLLRANQVEMEEIRALMIKLGEDPFVNNQNNNLHIIRSTPGRDTDQLLEKLKRIWPNVSPTPLDINVEDAAQPKPDGDSSDSSDKKDRGQAPKPENSEDTAPAKPDKKPEKEKSANPAPSATAVIRLRPHLSPSAPRSFTSFDDPFNASQDTLAENNTGASDIDDSIDTGNKSSANSNDAQSKHRFFGDRHPTTPTSTIIDPSNPSPISITKTPQGLIVTSRDQASLDQFMKLINELSPVDAHYHIINLKHADAKDVAVLLETVFQDDGAKKDNINSRTIYFFDNPPPEEKERNRLSKREPLRFIADPVTNSILVKGADDDQLAQIQALIEIYDRAT
ncbi:MAG TPA: secretin N-terminal domain-containing protein, partial [Pirellulales bacterium]